MILNVNDYRDLRKIAGADFLYSSAEDLLHHGLAGWFSGIPVYIKFNAPPVKTLPGCLF
jgi:hypothetical protein